MADNSIREQIILNLVAAIEGVSAVSKVARKKLGFDELTSISSTQFPYVAVMAGLPSATPKPSTRRQAIVDKFISELAISLTVYGHDNVNPDQAISSLVDDLWVAIFADPARNGKALATQIKPEVETGIFDPHYCFNLEVVVTYLHDRSSI